MPNDQQSADAGGSRPGPGGGGPGAPSGWVTQQATIGAHVDAGPGEAPSPGWWAVTDGGVRLFVPEHALAPRPMGGDAVGAGPLRTVRPGQRVELRWRMEGATPLVGALGLPRTSPAAGSR